MNDLVKQLKYIAQCIHIAVESPAASQIGKSILSAADEIERLKQENEELRGACLSEAMQATPLTPHGQAIAAGDGTLHGAIDHWQERALKAEADLLRKSLENA